MISNYYETVSYMCQINRHGTPTRRWVNEDGWEGMYQGTCAGTLYSATERDEIECDCHCHAVRPQL